MPNRTLLTSLAVPAVLTLASALPALGGAPAPAAAAKPDRPAAAKPAAPRPNLVFMMADDMGWADLSTGRVNGGYGNDFNETPFIDSLADEGQVFTEAYASVQCTPTRTALHTGQYATRPTNNVYAVGAITGPATAPLQGVQQGRTPTGNTPALPTGYTTVGETLQQADYATGYIGKFHVAGSAAEITESHGFDENWGGSQNSHATDYFATDGQFNDTVSPSLDTFGADYTQQYVDDHLKPYSHGVSDAQLDALVGTDKHVTDAQSDAAIDFISREKDEPFFAFVSYFAPHFPVNDAQARPDLLAKYRAKTPGEDPAKPSYAALVDGIDQSVARIVDYLETTPDPRNGGKPLSGNTLLVFTSDNGGEEDPANSGAWNGPLREDKGFMHDGGVRVPWIVWSQNRDLVKGGGRVNETIINSTDLYPTLASYAEATLPTGVPLDGIDLRPAFSKGAKIDRTHFHHLPGYVGQQGPASFVRDGRWKLIYNYTDASFELYDLIGDLGETTNLAADKPGLVYRLGSQLIGWLDETDAPLATLRANQPTRTITGFTGLAYDNRTVTDHRDATITIAPGQQVPFLLPKP